MCVIRHSIVDRGLFQDPDFAGDLEDSKATSGGKSGCLRKSNIRSHELEVQERNLSVSQFD